MNAFKYCGNSTEVEANLAFHFWTLDLTHLQEYVVENDLDCDLALAAVYMEWMDEDCAADLNSK